MIAFAHRYAAVTLTLSILLFCGCSANSRQNGRDAGIEDWDGPGTSRPLFASDASRRDDHGPSGCVDLDHDGFGVGCMRGPDCDDSDAANTDACYRCLRPATGCRCSTEDARPICDAVTDSNVPGPDGTCHLGERLCVNGVWSRCSLFAGAGIVVPPSQCNSCSPSCRATMVCPDNAMDLSAAGSATANGVVIGSNPASPLCPSGSPGGVQLPDGSGTASGSGGGGVTCTGVTCGGGCCGPSQVCVASGTSGTGASCSATSGSGVATSDSTCGLMCPAGTTHCGTAPTDQCCGAGYVCHSGGCVLGNPSGCHANHDCPLVASGQQCFSFGVCSTGTPAAGNCACTNAPNNGCFTAARAHGFQEVDNIFATNDGRDARQLRFARYIRGLDPSPTSVAPCTNANDCPVGRSAASTSGADPYQCPTCTPTNAGSFQGFSPTKDYATVAPFLDALDWNWVDFVRYNAAGAPDWGGGNEYPWNGLIFDLQVPSNQVAVFGIRNNGTDCCSQGMEFQVWMTDNPGATTVASWGTIDPQKWNLTSMTRMYTEGWTRNPTSRGSPTDSTDLADASTYGNAIADAYTTVWGLSGNCYAMRYAAINVGNMGEPGNSCDTGRVSNRLDAVAGLDANGAVPAIFHVLPYHATAGPDAITTSARVRSADLYFLVDTTASMSAELTALRASLTGSGGTTGCTFATGGIVGSARCLVPDPWFGVGAVGDFPLNPYGIGADVLFQNAQDLTSDTATVQTAMNALTIRNGGDAPDAHIQALWSLFTGLGSPVGAGYLADRTGCAAGRFGYPCFRPDALPIVLLYTDTMFHNGPAGSYPYDDTALRGSATSTTPQFVDAVAVLNNAGAKVIVIDSCGTSGCPVDAAGHANAIATQTQSLVSAGAPAVYPIATDGTGLGATTVTALTGLLANFKMDVSASAEDNPATPGVDERCFIANPAGTPPGTLRLSAPSLGEPAPYAAGQCASTQSTAGGVGYVAQQCVGGAAVGFRADFANECVRASNVDQRFTFDLVTRANGAFELERIAVTVVVPRASFPATGTYSYVVSSSGACSGAQQVAWERVLTDSTIPTGTSISIDVRTASTTAALGTALWVPLGTLTGTSTLVLPLTGTISDSIRAAAQMFNLPLLEVRFTLRSDPSRTLTPILSGYSVQFSCVDGT